MNAKPHVPDELIMFDRQFSWGVAWRVGRWWLVAFLISAICDVFFPELRREMTFGWRMAAVGAEFGAILLFCRDAAKWLGNMDELQRRLTLTIFLFAVSATFIFFLLWLRLENEGFFNTVFGPPFWKNHTWGISTVAHACTLLGGFYGVGFLVFKRRYK
jgi:hypothetical protein